MKNALKIFKRDIKAMVTNWAALIMVVILILIPSLYSLVNIKASWDPYGNTGGIQVAVVNEDEGTEFKGSDINLGDELVDKLKDNTKLGWNFLDKETATQGILEETYYAMIEIPADFSKNVTSLIEKDIKKPQIIYTVNEKKNSIAPKITDSGVKTVKTQLDNNIIKTISGIAFRVFNEVGVNVEDNRPELRRIIDAVYELDDKLPELEDVLSGAVDGTVKISDLLDKANYMLPTVSDILDSGQDFINSSSESLDRTQSDLEETSDSIKDDLIMVEGVLDTSYITLKNIDENILPDTAKKSIMIALDSINATNTTIENVRGKLKGIKKFIDKAADIEVKEVGEFSKKDVNQEVLHTEVLNNDITHANEKIKEVSNSNIEQVNESNEFVEAGKEDVVKDVINSVTTVDNNEESNGVVVVDGKSDESQIEEASDEMTLLADKVKEENAKITTIINEQIKSIKDTQKDLKKVSKKLNNVIEKLDNMYGDLNAVSDKLNEELSKIETDGKFDIQALDDIKKIIDDVHKLVSDIIDSYDSQIVSIIQEGFNYIREISDNGDLLISQGKNILPNIENLFNQFINVSDLSNEQLVKLNDKFPDIKEKVHKVASKLRSLDEEDQIDEILELITNNWQDQSDFLASPVELEDNRLFPWPNYGSSATPFYTILCLWVGGLIGSALLALKAPPLGEDIIIRPYEMYLGKLFTFITIAILQAIVASLGALFLLGTYTVHPVMFVFYSIFVSIVFVVIIYTAGSLFDDVGKTLMIFMLVLQMAGTSGNFPIQVTPTFFQKFYPILPFTYAISGMRQIMAGIVYSILIKDIVILIIYLVICLVLGILFKGIANKTTDKIVDKLLSSGILRH